MDQFNRFWYKVSDRLNTSFRFDGIVISDFAADIITFILYLIMFIAIWVLFSPSFVWMIKKSSMNTRYRRLAPKHKSSHSKVYEHIENLLYVTIGKEGVRAVYTFYIVSLTLFALATLLFISQLSIILALVASVFVGLLPYFYLQMRLSGKRITGSFEGQDVIAELINQYKLNNRNMIAAVDSSIVYLDDQPVMQRLLVRLGLSLKEYRNEEELMLDLRRFTYGVDTEWIKLLSNNIYLAVEDSMDVLISMEDILTELQVAKTNLEKAKRSNSEGFFIIRFFAPSLYLGVVYLTLTYFDLTFDEYVQNQFYTPEGIQTFMWIVILAAINILYMILFNRRKFDF